MSVAAVAVQLEVAERNVASSCGHRNSWSHESRIRRHSRSGPSIMNAVIVRARLDEESSPAAQARDTPIPSRGKKQSGDQRTPIEYQRDRIARGRACHG